MNTLEFLKNIVDNHDKHARWLNSLSYLEYRGFRKIARSQKTDEITSEILAHALEEIRHAIFFKRLATKIGGCRFENYSESTLLCETELKFYFFELDRRVSDYLQLHECSKLSNACYVLVTLLIERRALSVYRPYDELLRERGFTFSLASVLKEEHSHLEEMFVAAREVLLRANVETNALEKIETSCFKGLWEALTREICNDFECLSGSH